MAAETVGARLLLDGREQFVADAKASADSIDTITASADRASAALDRMAASSARMRDVSVDTAAVTDGSAAAAAATRDRTEAEEAENAVLDEQVVKQNKSTSALKDATNATKEHKSTLDSLAENSIIKGTALFGTGALAAGAYESIKAYTNFNKSVTQSAVDAGVPAKNLKGVQADLIQLSREYGVSVDDLANSWYRVASAMSGTHTTLAQMKQLTADTAKLDVLFNIPKGAPTEQTARVMGAFMNAHLQGATQPAQIEALLNAAVGRGDIRGQDLISAVGKMLPAAVALHASAPDMLAWVDTLTKEGMQGSQAGTLIAHSVQQLANPSEQGNKAEQMLGIQQGDLEQMMQKEGIPKTIAFLKQSMTKFNPTSYYPSFSGNAAGSASALAQAQAWGINPGTLQAWQSGTMNKTQTTDLENELLVKIFGGAKSALPMLALMSNPAKYAELDASIKAGATPQALAESFKLAMNTPGRQMQIAEANVRATSIGIGKELTPAATEAFRIFGNIAQYLSEHTGVLEGLLGALTAFVGSAILVEGAKKIKNVAEGISDIAKAASNVIYKVSGGVFGTAAQLGPDEIFAGAVTEFAGAVSAFAAEEGVAGAEGIAGKGLGAAETAAAGGGAKGIAAAAASVIPYAVPAIAAAAVGALAYGAADLSKKSGANSNLNYLLGNPLQVNGKTFVSVMQVEAAQLYLAHHPTKPYSESTEPGPGSPGGPWVPPGKPKPGPPLPKPGQPFFQTPFSTPGTHPVYQHPLTGNLASSVQHMLATVAAAQHNIFNPKTAEPYSTAQYQKNEADAGSKALSAASKDLSAAGKLHTEAATQENAASKSTGEAAEKHKEAAAKLNTAAQQHAEAAAKLATAASQIDNAATKLANTKITAQISAAAVTAANTAAQANTTARS